MKFVFIFFYQVWKWSFQLWNDHEKDEGDNCDDDETDFVKDNNEMN